MQISSYQSRFGTRVRLILFSLFHSLSCRGNAILEKPGCYQLTGVVERIFDSDFVIVTRPGTVSAQAVKINSKQIPPKVNLKETVSLEVIANAGPVSGPSSKIVFSKILAKPPEKTLPWKWRGELREGRCR